MLEWIKNFILKKVIGSILNLFKKSKSTNFLKNNSNNGSIINTGDGNNKGNVIINGDGDNKVDLDVKYK